MSEGNSTSVVASQLNRTDLFAAVVAHTCPFHLRGVICVGVRSKGLLKSQVKPVSRHPQEQSGGILLPHPPGW